MDGFSYKPLWMIKQRDSVKIVLLLDKWEIIRRLHLLAEFGERERLLTVYLCPSVLFLLAKCRPILNFAFRVK